MTTEEIAAVFARLRDGYKRMDADAGIALVSRLKFFVDFGTAICTSPTRIMSP
jgi:hypothetical protein